MDNGHLRDTEGTIFNIQHYCIHDGPGIRTNVFLKGCPLRCLWCANPESQKPYPQIMYRRDLCVKCGACADICPVHAIALTPEGVLTQREKCTGCGKCASVCRPKARELSGYRITAGEVFDEIAGDALFYGDDGGVTVTGGEALAQPDFTRAILSLCKDSGIHTAIETCGHAKWSVMEPILRLTDVVLYDLKEMDSVLHKQYTGADNSLILENLLKINEETDCEIWVRVPVIPGYNADEKNISAIGKFVKENLSHCTQVHLLPFHDMGLSKFEQLENPTNHFTSFLPSDSEMDSLRNIIKSYHITYK